MGSKGSPGEASIFRAKDGRCHGWITVGTRANGKPDRRHRTAKTRSEVVRKIRELEVRRETGTNTAVNSDTVEAWFRHWITNIAARLLRPAQWTAHRQEGRLRRLAQSAEVGRRPPRAAA